MADTGLAVGQPAGAVTGGGGVQGKTPTTAKRYRERYEKLKQNAQTFWDHYKDLADHIEPRGFRRPDEVISDKNQGTKRNDKIINSTATRSLRILTSGMHGGISSPARPWFNLLTREPESNKVPAVREWLTSVRDQMLTIFARSNVYNVLPETYSSLALFGTAGMSVEQDDIDVIRCTAMTVGTFHIATDSKKRVNTVYRLLGMTTEQLVSEFGYENCSMSVRAHYDRQQFDETLEVLHIVEPNDLREPRAAGPAGMRWRSVWMERRGNDDKLLRVAGFNEFPFMVPRWSVAGEDDYGSKCPGMDALGDIKELQHHEKRKAQALDKITNPPMNAPGAAGASRWSQMPGDVNYLGQYASAGHRFEPSVVVDPRVLAIREDIGIIEQRIGQTFMADLFLMLANTAIPGMTAREVEERHEEKMLQLGPVLERLQDELLGPLIDRTFDIMVRQGLIPEPPEQIQGQPLRVEYISILAEAQKLLGTVAVERLARFVIEVASGTQREEVLDNLNFDAMVPHYANLLGTAPELVNSPQAVLQLREQRQQQIEAQQAAELAKAGRDAGAGIKSVAEAGRIAGQDEGLGELLTGAGIPAGVVGAA